MIESLTPTQQLWAALVGALVFIIAAATPLVVAKIRVLRKEAEVKEAELDGVLLDQQRKQQTLQQQVAKQSAFYAAEVGDAARPFPLDGGERAKVADEFYAKKLPDVPPKIRELDVRAAVGEIPGLGASGKKAAS